MTPEQRTSVREALEIGRDAAFQVAQEYHDSMKGYFPEQHAAVDADVAKIDEALAILRADEQQEPQAQDLPPKSIPRDEFTGEQLRAAYEVCTASVRTTKRDDGAGNFPVSPAAANPLDAASPAAPVAQDEREALRELVEALDAYATFPATIKPALTKARAALSAATPPAAVPTYQPMTEADVQAVVSKAVSDSRLSWLGFKADAEGRYTIPVMSPADHQFARAIESAVLARVVAAPAAVPMSQKTQDGHSASSVAEAPTTQLPEGWVLAPLWPTPEMIDAWINTPPVPSHELDEASERRDVANCYRAMLAAAPQPAGTQSDTERDAARYRHLQQGRPLTVVVPTPTEDKPNKKVTVIYGPNPEPAWGESLSKAIDAAMGTTPAGGENGNG